MKNILFFSTSMRYNGGGIMCLLDIIKYVGAEIHPIVVLSGHGTTEEELKKRGIEYYVIRSFDWLIARQKRQGMIAYVKRLVQCTVNLCAEVRMLALLKKRKIDVLHINSVYNGCGAIASHWVNIPVVWHIREFSELGVETPVFWNRGKSYRLMAMSACLIGVSKCICERYHKVMNTAIIKCVYDGVDFEMIRPSTHQLFADKKVRILMSGGISRIKGHIDAITALGILNKKELENELELHIVGRGMDQEYVDSLHTLASQEGVESRVIFHDFMYDMNGLLEQMDIVLICSRYESFGRACVEGMIKRCVVIGANNTGTDELLRQGMYGKEYMAGDAKQLAEQIIYVLDHKAEMTEIAMKAGKYAEESYSARRNAQLVTDVLLNACNGR